jgi:hypothetical protein
MRFEFPNDPQQLELKQAFKGLSEWSDNAIEDLE